MLNRADDGAINNYYATRPARVHGGRALSDPEAGGRPRPPAAHIAAPAQSD